ncbi:MAG: DegT/DnrJ/EryC1/StrS family aminotransferase [Nitrospirae bacterium]|nr:DegT/DnrJ/EryC1/StrS family aminotransferase [Nitrospirota bacterium]
MNNIPFLDLVTPHKEIEEELVAVFREALRTGRFIGGPNVDDFEKDFAAFCDVQHCIGVASGTDALRFALIAAGIRQGETVITVPNTFIATTESISQAGASIAFVDIDERTYNIDTEKLREYLETQCVVDDKTGKPINKKTKGIVSAIIPVHLYGQMADMDSIAELAEKYHLIVIEDACQAHGAEYLSASPTLEKGEFENSLSLREREGVRVSHSEKNHWKKAGSLGLAAAFSFYPGKNLGAFGEAGAVTTNDEEIARKIRMIRDHGQSQKYFHDIEGYNGRLDALQAGILHEKLKHLSEGNEKRRQSASLYNVLLNEVDGVITPYEPDWSRAVYHLYVIRTRNRDKLLKHLAEKQIGTGLHYPLPLHLQKAYECLGFKEGDFPVSEKVATEILSLPMFPGLLDDQQKYVAESIKNVQSKPSACTLLHKS